MPKKNPRADENLDQALHWIRRARDRRFFLFLHFDDPHLPFIHPAELVRPASAAALDRFDLRLPLNLQRVPLVIKPPAGGPYRRGAVVTPRVRAFDLMPTLFSAAFQRGRFKYILPVGRGIYPGRSEAPELGGVL